MRLPTDRMSAFNYPPSFKAPPHWRSRKPVKGGRWRIRKYRKGWTDKFYWRAWRDGKSGRTFSTWEEAWAWVIKQAYPKDIAASNRR